LFLLLGVRFDWRADAELQRQSVESEDELRQRKTHALGHVEKSEPFAALLMDRELAGTELAWDSYPEVLRIDGGVLFVKFSVPARG
jgi:hypothetical protein